MSKSRARRGGGTLNSWVLQDNGNWQAPATGWGQIVNATPAAPANIVLTPAYAGLARCVEIEVTVDLLRMTGAVAGMGLVAAGVYFSSLTAGGAATPVRDPVLPASGNFDDYLALGTGGSPLPAAATLGSGFSKSILRFKQRVNAVVKQGQGLVLAIGAIGAGCDLAVFIRAKWLPL